MTTESMPMPFPLSPGAVLGGSDVHVALPSDVTQNENQNASEATGAFLSQAHEAAAAYENRVMGNMRCFVAKDPQVIAEARKLTATFYLRRNFITADQVGKDGTIKPEFDPHIDHSDYYVLMNDDDQLVATARKTRYDPKRGEGSFPVMEHKDKLDPKVVAELEKVGMQNFDEIGALVKNPALDIDKMAALRLYRTMFLDAWADGQDQKGFIMACNPVLFQTFQYCFGDSMRRMGPDLEYPGQVAVPAYLPLKKAALEVVDESVSKSRFADVRHAVLSHFFGGADAQKIDPDIVTALKDAKLTDVLATMPNSGVEAADLPEPATFADMKKGIVRAKIWEAIDKRKPEIIAAVGLLGYTALRTFGVAEGVSPTTDVDWRIFLGIEVATTPQYVLGMGDLARSVAHPERYSNSRRIGAAALAGTGLLAPYAYVIAEGEGMPGTAWAGVAAVGLASLVSVGRKLIQARRDRRSDAQNVSKDPET